LDILEIRLVEVGLEDLEQLKYLSRRTFYATFGDVNTPGNMQLYDQHHFSDEQIRSEILNPDSRFYFALYGGEVQGYVKINLGMAQTVLPNDGGMEIERIYVDQLLKGRGIGTLLIEKTIQLATQSGAKYIWLGVWEHNTSAIGFYEKNGFLPYSQHFFQLGNDIQTDILMKFSLHQQLRNAISF
jgi:diamine N-acetyltransferase